MTIEEIKYRVHLIHTVKDNHVGSQIELVELRMKTQLFTDVLNFINNSTTELTNKKYMLAEILDGLSDIQNLTQVVLKANNL